MEAAIWLAHALGLDADDRRGRPDAEAVIRTALLLHTSNAPRCPTGGL